MPEYPVLLCLYTYRHPNTDAEEFIHYMDKVTTKIVRENKLIFCMGDFLNVNLLNYNVHNPTNDLDSLLSNYLLPLTQSSSSSCYTSFCYGD